MKKILPYNLVSKFILIFSVVFSAFIFLLNFFYNARISYDATEKVTYEYHFVSSLIMLVIFSVLLFIFSLFKNKLENVNEKTVFIVLSALYTVAAIYLILNVEPVLRADARAVSKIAKAILENDFDRFSPGKYIYRYPHQLGIVFFTSILYRFSENIAISFIVNFCFVLGINFTLYKISDNIFQNKTVNILTIIFSFAFLPQFFFILFAYGLIPGFFFMILSFYHALKFSKNHKLMNLLCLVVTSSVAICLKKNCLIGIIAIIIFFLLKALKKYNHKYLLAVFLLILSMILPTKIITSCFEAKSGFSLNEQLPTVLWIAMGTDIDNTIRAPGWYDGSTRKIYDESDFDKEIASETGKNKLINNLNKIKEDPLKAYRFFKYKTISQWCEPLYSSIRSGPLEARGQYTNTDLLKSIYNDEDAEDRLEVFSKFLMLILWGFALSFLLKYSKIFEGWEMIYLFFIGGLLFHTIWEGKSQYIYPYVFCLIPFAMYSLYKTSDKIQYLLNKRKKLK